MNVVGDNIVLRAVERADLPLLHGWANDPEIQYNLGRWHFPLSEADLEGWFEGFRYDGTDQRFMIDTSDHGAIGMTNLVDINWKDRNAFTGLLIGTPALRRKGYGKDAVTTMMRYAFEELGLERLDTTIIAHNKASLDLYLEKCGWIEEGRKGRVFFRRNEFHDNVILGVTRDRYREFVEASEAIR
ncbi:MAG: GNAT family N-acetyltransferase [Alphaproteobacteria bacterium]|nr:GNAT family N-acetyltransferase [Alphaproteobacteria bacterium]